jgi:hypothetical protein
VLLADLLEYPRQSILLASLKVDPLAYLTDVLRRVSTHPARRIEELLPDRWQELRAVAAMVDDNRAT